MPAPSTTVTAPLQRDAVRDATGAVLRRPRSIAALVVALVVLLVGVWLVVASGPRNETLFLVVAPVVFAVAFVLTTRRSVRRRVSAALPVGSTVEADRLARIRAGISAP